MLGEQSMPLTSEAERVITILNNVYDEGHELHLWFSLQIFYAVIKD